MNRTRPVLAALSALLLMGAAPGAYARDLHGVALVIGESDYDSDQLRDLANPKNDARAMDEMLGNLGFDVDRALNDNRADLTSDIDRFVRDAKDADVALVYYSGHGIEAGGEDYLVPTDADISSPNKAGESLVPLKQLLDELAKTVPVTIVLLDACRTNAFPAGTTIELPGTSQVIDVATTGLGEVRGPTPLAKPDVAADSLGMVIGFAAAPGQAALDGDNGGNSPYAAALLKHLGAGGYSFGDVMTMVSEEVYLKTNAQQLPWTNSSLRRVLSFGAPSPAGDADEASIRDGRRQLLLSIASTPEDLRKEVEAAAATAAVPMDALYGLLQALGQNVPSDPAALDALLKTQTETIKKVMTERAALTSTDPEIVRLSELAQQALDEGTLDVSVKFWEEAKARYLDLSKTLDDTEADLKARRLEGGAVIAKTADAYNLKGDYDMAAENYRLAFEQVARWDRTIAAGYKGSEAEMLRAVGDGRGDNDVLRQSVEAFGDALKLLPRSADRLRWAELQDGLGYALSTLGARETGTDDLKAAVVAYRASLKERTRKRVPLDWARTQGDLGIAFAQLGEREVRTDSLKAAATAFRAALEEETRDRVPLEWATTQTNLANVLSRLGQREPGTDNLNAAVAAYRGALEEATRERSPFQWALTQLSLGSALKVLGDRTDDIDSLNAAVTAYQAAVEVMTRERLPLYWAGIQNNLGNALRALGSRESGTDSLMAAIAAYRAALEEQTRERAPLDWAGTQNNLGYALTVLGRRETGTDSFNAAIAAFHAALEEQTRESTPIDWAQTQSNLGNALEALGDRMGGKAGDDPRRAAIVAWQASAEISTKDDVPIQWGILQNSIGFNMTVLGEYDDDLAQFEAAIPILREGLAVEQAVLPENGPFIQDSLCRALLGLGSRTNDRDMLSEAKATCEAAITGKQEQGADTTGTQIHLDAINAALAKLPLG